MSKNNTNQTICVGLDIGRSATKACCRVGGDKKFHDLDLIPSVACPASHIQDADEALRAAADTVTLEDGSKYWFGQTAQLHGRAQNPGLWDDWPLSPEYQALIRGALQKVREKAGEGDLKIVAGLPCSASQDLYQKVRDIILTAAGGSAQCKVLAQPSGVFFLCAAENPALREANVAVLDLGRFSADTVLVAQGRPVTSSFKSFAGARFAIDLLGERIRERVSVLPSFDRLERALIEERLVVNTKPIDIAEDLAVVKAQFAEEISRSYQVFAHELGGAIDHVLLTGGGAQIVAEALTKHINVDVPKNSRRLVSRGFCYAAGFL